MSVGSVGFGLGVEQVPHAVVANGSGAALAAKMGERDLAGALAKLQGISRREAKRKKKTAESKSQQPDAGNAFDEGDINAELFPRTG